MRRIIIKKKKVEDNNLKSDSIGRFGSWSDIIGVFINAVMATFTLLLFNQAVKQNSISEKNILLADSMYQLSRQIFDSSIVSARESAEMQKKTFDAQITSLKSAAQRLARESDVFLRLTADPTAVIQFQPGKSLQMVLDLKNLGKYPVELIGSNCEIQIRNNLPTKEDINNASSQHIANQFITPENPLSFVVRGKLIDKYDYMSVIHYKRPIYIYGFFTYENHITNQKKRYKFILSCDGFLTTSYTYSSTENL